ncbi:DUF1501 domain-containing protein [Marinibactrum halimedae]|uniref:DUF1501 domain-containing protein n=1 Tax=Marinibactrum halimedae TaxID=1444977 RepID=A0AA37T1V6_9GAMM|nr:DUF1501 domain-containing protein [Marinibactrum halimedae]MCD9459097.1 DUF1501 domain-containing protein [Marinibactrum halimedae]GLS24698.1 hypothetical protein GCM10007877_04120 [Marinibactrum halimedae]
MKNVKINRRGFINGALKLTAGATVAYTASGVQMLNAAIPNDQGDYKALVCVFLYGGNDSHNMLVPMEGSVLADYQTVRGSLARQASAEMEIFPEGQSFEGRLAFVDEMSAVKALFDRKKLAIQGNVGALISPLPNGPKPKGLFAHNASQENWMRGADLGQKPTGWGGRLLDAYFGDAAENTNFLRNISIGGSNSWQTGLNSRAYSVPTSGEIGKDYRYSRSWDNRRTHRQELIDNYHGSYQSDHILKSAFSRLYNNAVDNNAWLAEELSSVSIAHEFPDSSLGKQLGAVAKFIRLGKAQGLKRQVFFVGLGGFDTHNNQVNSHPGLLSHVSNAMASFYDFTENERIANEITSFTMSDFGRSIRSNGNGTDHGWAGHQFIVGGAVEGGKIYGDLPYQNVNTSLRPTTSNEQMFASLARWYGFNDDSVLNNLFPNLKHFSSNFIHYFA